MYVFTYVRSKYFSRARNCVHWYAQLHTLDRCNVSLLTHTQLHTYIYTCIITSIGSMYYMHACYVRILIERQHYCQRINLLKIQFTNSTTIKSYTIHSTHKHTHENYDDDDDMNGIPNQTLGQDCILLKFNCQGPLYTSIWTTLV